MRPTVKIGLVAPFEGRYRSVGYDAIYAARLAVREVNEAGGIGGYNVELVAYDDRGDPTMARQQARKLTIDPDVIGVIGHFREQTTLAAREVYVDAGVPLIAPGVFGDGFTLGTDRVFHLGPTGQQMAEAVFDLVVVPRDRVALATDGGALGRAFRIVESEYIVPISAPAEEWVVEILASDPEAVVCDADPVTAAETVRQLHERGWDGRFVGGPGVGTANFSGVAGEAAEGVRFVTPWPWVDDAPGTAEGRSPAEFVEAYQAVSVHVPPPGPLALPAYEATWLMLQALERDIVVNGAPTRAGVGEALRQVEREGLLGQIAFNEARRWPLVPLYVYALDEAGIPRLVDN